MNRRFIATHARALPGVVAFVCMSVCMTLGLGGVTSTAAGLRCPGEGDAASP